MFLLDICPIPVNMVVNGEIDVALADLTITPRRLARIDFSIPIATEGLAIFRKKPDTKGDFLASFHFILSCSLFLT